MADVKIRLPTPIPGPLAEREQARLDALAHYDILDTPQEEAFDGLTRLAKRLFGVQMSTITFVDGHRQWFKAQQGMTTRETERDPAFCYAAIQQPEALIVLDAAADRRFAENPFVTGEPHIRFYAGVQLRSAEGEAIGTLCAMDPAPRQFGAEDAVALADLGRIANALMELRRITTQARRSAVAAGTPMLKAGRISFGNESSVRNCTVKALSQAGASVDVISTMGIPDRVALLIDMDSFSRLCLVTARTDRSLELSFES